MKKKGKKTAKRFKKWQVYRIQRDVYKGMAAYWKEQAKEARKENAPLLALYALVLDGAELELEEARAWSAAWKASAKKYREESIMLGRMLAQHARWRDKAERERDELHRLMLEKVTLSPYCGRNGDRP